MIYNIMKIIILVTLFTFSSCCSGFSVNENYATGIQGVFTCNGKPLSNATIQIYDKNTIGKDTELATGYSDEKGRFGIRATEKILFGNFEPYYVVIHKCNYENQVCKRKFTGDIEEKYIEKGSTKAYDVYNVGTLELSTTRSNEKRDCSV
uniref:Transthyretin-like family protein n=1 Tax=Parastrongyloides trichosuri TaxID=131310 RepID=A0A0N4ZIE2_PARTI